MSSRVPSSILQVSAAAAGGGAAEVARTLHEGFRREGHTAVLAVGRRGEGDGVVRLRNGRGAWSQHWWSQVERLRDEERPRRALFPRALVTPGVLLDDVRGREDFRYPGTSRLLEQAGIDPDVILLHNLHTGYFDLRELPRLSARKPIVLCPHDPWLTTGHCAHSLECARWETGCGSCPHLDVYPSLRRDGTAFNWVRKRDIYAASSVRVASPCRWLLDRLERSILAPAIVESRVIPHGVDLDLFRPGDGAGRRNELGIPPEATVFAVSALGLRESEWKDYATLRAALAMLETPVLMLAIGDAGPTEEVGVSEIRYLAPVPRHQVGSLLRVADAYVHPARAETFPLAAVEALASGLPVVASAVGGLPELVQDGVTGALVPPGDAASLAVSLELLALDGELRSRLGAAAAADAARRFDVRRQVTAYVDWVEELRGQLS